MAAQQVTNVPAQGDNSGMGTGLIVGVIVVVLIIVGLFVILGMNNSNGVPDTAPQPGAGGTDTGNSIDLNVPPNIDLDVDMNNDNPPANP